MLDGLGGKETTDQLGSTNELRAYGTKPHAVTQVGSTSYTYDSNGNMLRRGSDNLTWDAENRPVSVVTSNGTSTLVYDGDGKRVMKIEGGQTIIYINKFFEKSGTDNVSYYYLGGPSNTGRMVDYHENSDGEAVSKSEVNDNIDVFGWA